MEIGLTIVFLLLALLVVVTLAKTIKIIPQARSGIVERFGKYRNTLSAGLNVITPWVDKVRYIIDMREQVVSFPPQPVITEDNLVVSIDTVIYFQVTNPVSATYEIANYIQAVEQLTTTTLRNIIGGMDLEQTLTSREEINRALRGVLDEATGKWGIRVNRVELKGIDPPPSIKDSMEKQMRADRDKRAAILTAEGMRQSAILTAEGEKQSAILTAEGDRESAILRAQADREAAILRAQGEAQAIGTVFQSIHDGAPDQRLLAYQYLQMLPKIAEGQSNKMWIIPSEIGDAIKGLGSAIGQIPGIPVDSGGPKKRVDLESTATAARTDEELSAAHDAAAEAIASARDAASPSSRATSPIAGLGTTASEAAARLTGAMPPPPPGADQTDADADEADQTDEVIPAPPPESAEAPPRVTATPVVPDPAEQKAEEAVEKAEQAVQKAEQEAAEAAQEAETEAEAAKAAKAKEEQSTVEPPTQAPPTLGPPPPPTSPTSGRLWTQPPTAEDYAEEEDQDDDGTGSST
jgi:regulator of protease activity HflC (stomatin/prohibitin superfamily)